MKVEAMVLRFSKPSSSALTSPSVGDRAWRSARLSCPQTPPWPPSAALTRQKGWGTAEVSGQVSRHVPASPAPQGQLGARALLGSVLARRGRPWLPNSTAGRGRAWLRLSRAVAPSAWP